METFLSNLLTAVSNFHDGVKDTDPMDREEMESLEGTLSEEVCDAIDSLPSETIEGVHTYADRGILTTDSGLVLTMSDGSEYQITVVKSK